MNYKKTGVLLLFLGFSSYAQQPPVQENEIEDSEKSHASSKSTTKNNKDVTDVITVIADTSSSEQLTKINSVIAGRSTLSSSLIEQKQADNVAELLNTLPGVSMTGSMRPNG